MTVSRPPPSLPRLRAFGDAAVLVEMEDLSAAQHLAVMLGAEMVGRRAGAAEDVVLGFGTVTILMDPRRSEPASVLDEVDDVVRRAIVSPRRDPPGDPAREVLDVPVCFDGPDLADVGAALGWSPGRVVEELALAPLAVAFLGFAPGFGYLHGLPAALAGLPRRHRPRPVVPAGSVAVGGGFAAVYPQATPGGWHLVGRTGLVLFDPERPPYAELRPGQHVRLRPTAEVPEPPAPRRRHALRAGDGPALVVERAGSWTTVQDEGRRGFAALGVPRAGAMDPLSLVLGNRLVGNPDVAGALESTAMGPVLRATAPCHAAVLGSTGSDGIRVTVDGRRVPDAAVVPLDAGARLEAGDGGGARALVAVSGGVEVQPVLGSRSTDQLCGLGPGPLRQGDELALGTPGRPRGTLRIPAGLRGDTVLRVVAGPDAPGAADGPGALETLLGGSWVVGQDSNRVGTRLQALHPRRVAAELPGVVSRGMVRGAVQCPPGGELVVLGPDHATVGGYPVPAVVITADHHRLAHVVPGDTVRFEVVDMAVARLALRRLDAETERAVGGWFPTRAG